jgi:broad specificity phosphatase PhoE
MGELLVVRHGQASFDKAHYDELSDLGRRQAALLGQWLAPLASSIGAVAMGRHVRHRDTLTGIRAALGAQGDALPQVQVIPELDEFDHSSVLAAWVRARPDHAAVLDADGGRSRDRQAMASFLREGLQYWASGALDDHLAEPWHGFRDRIGRAAGTLAALGNAHRRVLVVTSGGVMSQLAQRALGLDDRRAVDLNLTIRNSAVCEFQAEADSLRLSSWNMLPHLAAPEHRTLWTYY